MDYVQTLDRSRMEKVEKCAREVLAPSVVEFAKWILRSAGEKHFRRIYFLARDGYPVYEAARILAQGTDPPVDCRYLVCSRYSLRIPAFYYMERSRAAEQICRGGVDVTLRKILRRGGLTGTEIERAGQAAGFDGRLDRLIPYSRLPEIRSRLLRTELFWSYVSAHAARACRSTLPYLAQEGLFDPVRYALADSGWTGSMQLTLQNLLEHAGFRGRLEGFYYGLYQIPEEAYLRDYHAYYFSPSGKIKRKVYFSNSLFECICSEPAGMCTGYARKDSRVVPVREKKQEYNAQILEIVAEAVKERAIREKKGLPEALHDWHLPDPGTAQKKLARLMAEPTRQEAAIFGSMSFSDDVLNAGQRLASPLNPGQIRENSFWNRSLTMAGLKNGTIRESAWMEGSILLGSRHVKRDLLQNRLYKYALEYRRQIREYRER